MKCKFPKSWQVYGFLIYDTNKEEGRLRLTNIPRDVVGLDILGDWVVELQGEYKKLQGELR